MGGGFELTERPRTDLLFFRNESFFGTTGGLFFVTNKFVTTTTPTSQFDKLGGFVLLFFHQKPDKLVSLCLSVFTEAITSKKGENVKGKGLLVIALLIAALLLVCKSFGPSPVGEKAEVAERVEAKAEYAEVKWVEINPPPGVKGHCYAFFQDTLGEYRYQAYGHSGVFCFNVCSGQ